ncbi:MAG: hypothetical protein E7578_02720 [Ruminococcaceae bacterium]|nr:hypothetical protein [Oscillospiraceae bacterium]
MKNENFFDIARDAIEVEVQKLEAFTDELDHDLTRKREMIAEYKCAKYRHAGMTNISARFYFCNKFGYKYEKQYYQLPDVWELVKEDSAFFEAVDNAPEDEKRTVALYLGILAYADHLISEKESLIATATDWEKVELEEYLVGHRFARKCIVEAWEV